MPDHPIFHDIDGGDLEAMQARVLADPAVLEERESKWQRTPLMYAIVRKKLAITLWLIEHRGQHDLDSGNSYGSTAMHYASRNGLLSVVQGLAAAGANPAAITSRGQTPLMTAAHNNHPDVVTFLLGLPAVKATIDHISTYQSTTLSLASSNGHQPIVQLLLDAGADRTISAGHRSPLNQALHRNHHAVAALLRRAIAEPERVKALHKSRSLLDPAGPPACLQGRVAAHEPLPRVELNTNHEDERLRAVAAFALGLEGGEEDEGLLPELYVELLTYMLPAWADKGPNA